MSHNDYSGSAAPTNNGRRFEFGDRRLGARERRATRGGRHTLAKPQAAAVASVPALERPLEVTPRLDSAPLPPENEMWEVGHVARFLKRSESWVYKKTGTGVLPVHRLDGWGLRYVPAEIRGWAGEGNKKKHR